MFYTKARRIEELEAICDRYQEVVEMQKKNLDMMTDKYAELRTENRELRHQVARHLETIGRLPTEIRKIVEEERR